MVRKQRIIGNRKISKCLGNSKKVFTPKYKIIILLLLVTLGIYGYFIALDISEANNTLPASLIEEISNSYGITITGSSSFTFLAELFGQKIELIDKNDSDVAKKTVACVKKALGQLPSEFIENSGLKRIVLCKTLTVKGHTSGVVVFLFDPTTMYLQISESQDSSTIMHELFHVVEYSSLKNKKFQQDWSSLNSIGFKYGRKHETSHGICNVSNPIKGFASLYGMRSPREDRAVIFEHLLDKEKAYRLKYSCKTDHVLAAKVELLEKQLLTLSDNLDHRFWDSIKPDRQKSRYASQAQVPQTLRYKEIENPVEFSKNRTIVNFSNDVSVEFVAIKSSSYPATWFKSDGDKLSYPLYNLDRNKTPPNTISKSNPALSSRYDLAFIANGVNAKNVSILDMEAVSCVNQVLLYDDEGGFYSNYCNLTVVKPSSSKGIKQLGISVPSDVWQTEGIYQDVISKDDILKLENNQVAIEAIPFNKDVIVHANSHKRRLRLTVYLKMKSMPVLLWPNSTNNTSCTCTSNEYVFWINDVELDDIAKIEVQTPDQEIKYIDIKFPDNL